MIKYACWKRIIFKIFLRYFFECYFFLHPVYHHFHHLAMDLPSAWCQVCVCGCTFSVPQAYTCHKHSCQKTKKRLSSALDKAKEVWQSSKCQKMEAMQSPTMENPPDQNVAIEQESTIIALALEHEVRLMLMQLIAHWIAIIPVRVPPYTMKT